MREFAAAWAVVCAFGCATAPPQPPVVIAALALGPSERVAVQQIVSVFDASATIAQRGGFAAQKSVYRGFVSGMPDGDYAAGAVAFGGYARQAVPLAPFSRTDLAQHAMGIAPLGEGTPLDRVLGELRERLAGRGGRAAVVIWSDGSPSDPVGRETGTAPALEAARALAAAHGGELCFHTVQAGDDAGGAAFLAALASLTPCGSQRALAELRDPARLAEFVREVFLGR
jgi:hypothetical protein